MRSVNGLIRAWLLDSPFLYLKKSGPRTLKAGGLPDSRSFSASYFGIGQYERPKARETEVYIAFSSLSAPPPDLSAVQRPPERLFHQGVNTPRSIFSTDVAAPPPANYAAKKLTVLAVLTLSFRWTQMKKSDRIAHIATHKFQRENSTKTSRPLLTKPFSRCVKGTVK